MKKIMLIGCSALVFSTVVAQTKGAVKSVATEQKTAQPRVKQENKTLLWKISGNGLEKASYLFGTMHLLCAEDTRLSENLKTIIRETDQIYFEIDMDDMTEMMSALKYLKMDGHKKLSDLLSEDEYARVKAYFSKNPSIMPLEMMETFKPYFISSLLSEQSMKCAGMGGMEQAIIQEATPYKKEIKGLETIQFQASVFDSIPYEKQAKELLKAIDSSDSNSRLTQELVSVYKEQDLDKIAALTDKEDGTIAEYIDLLLYNRNADWAVKMKNIMNREEILFAVGAAHLPGNRGVINLLKKAGFTLTPVSN